MGKAIARGPRFARPAQASAPSPVSHLYNRKGGEHHPFLREIGFVAGGRERKRSPAVPQADRIISTTLYNCRQGFPGGSSRRFVRPSSE